MSTTSAPWLVASAPSVTPSTRTIAAPTAWARSGPSWSGTVPRTSYALKTLGSGTAEDPTVPAGRRSRVRRAQDPQVAAAPDLDRRQDRLGPRPRGLPDGVGQRLEVVA